MNGKSDLLSGAAYDRVVNQWNRTDKDYRRNNTLHEIFQEQVYRTPDAIALVYEQQRLTYRELNEKSNQLARYIRQRYSQRTGSELKADTLIGLLVNRGLEMIVGMLAILKAGAAYVPIDPSYPQDRVEYIIGDTATELIMTQQNTIAATKLKLPEEKVLHIDLNTDIYTTVDLSDLKGSVRWSNLAYVIYTSGTTGKPKGVMLEHRSVVNTIEALYPVYDREHIRKVAAYSSFAFDVSVSEIFTTLSQGLELHILADRIKLDVTAMTDYFRKQGIHLAFLPPAMLGQFYHQTFPELKRVIYAGEACSKPSAKLWTDKKIALYNYYGPTETCIYSTGTPIIADEVERIGKPIQNTRVYILDRNQTPVPIGVGGELYIGGSGVARGYLNQPSLTAERFVNNPFASEEDIKNGYTRLYKTGDLVRWLDDGNIEFIGRNDDQVKIRGFRVELAEIEHAMLQIDGIQQCCALIREKSIPAGENKYLVAYYVSDPARETKHNEATIMRQLRQILPHYMVPHAIVSVDFFPLNTNGKLDKQALPNVAFSNLLEYVAPVTEQEILLCKIWEEVLGVQPVGLNDNFFKIGGDSIQAVRLCHRLTTAFKCRVTPADVFKFSTVSTLKDVLISTDNVVSGEEWEVL